MSPEDRIRRLIDIYRGIPYGGAALQIDNIGRVSNGVVIVAAFSSRRSAIKCLREHGFRKLHYGWKLQQAEARSHGRDS